MSNQQPAVIEDSITISNHGVQLGAIRADSPVCVVDVATEIANRLSDVMERQHLYSTIQGKKFPKCEGWTTCAAMLGINPRERYVKEDEEGNFEAYVELIDSIGNVVGGASAIVGNDEKTWQQRPKFARRSMAVTRATAKACRLRFSWIMALANYEATPAEELEPEKDERYDPKRIDAQEKAREKAARKASGHVSATRTPPDEEKLAGGAAGGQDGALPPIVEPGSSDWRDYKLQRVGAKAYDGKKLGGLAGDIVQKLWERRGKPYINYDADPDLMVEAGWIQKAYDHHFTAQKTEA